MKKREPVSNIMTKNVAFVNEADHLKDVVATLKKMNIRHIPVMKGNEVTGIISRTDVNRLTFGALFENQEGADEAVLEMLNISQVMTAKPRTVSSDTLVKEVAEIFASEDYHALPVVDSGELVGIVTTTDVIKYMLENF